MAGARSTASTRSVTGVAVSDPASAPPAFHLLAKPTGAVCNLDCSYCFFLSKEMLYPGSRFRMADDLLESWRDRPLYTQDGDVDTARSVTPLGYGRFLIDVFEEWVGRDVAEVYVQMFDTTLVLRPARSARTIRLQSARRMPPARRSPECPA
jgi:sulfatase maturation enzyme AslB (radical SAM superfamily)